MTSKGLQQTMVMKTKNNIFINGCFDVLHAGHCRFLNYCVQMKKFYDAEFIVAIDSDGKVKSDKGDNRPYFTSRERMLTLREYCPEIDEIFTFENHTELIEYIQFFRPILIKGERWRGKVVGSHVAREVIYVPDFPDLPSTTEIEKRING